jgi:hypothetical protein
VVGLHNLLQTALNQQAMGELSNGASGDGGASILKAPLEHVAAGAGLNDAARSIRNNLIVLNRPFCETLPAAPTLILG